MSDTRLPESGQQAGKSRHRRHGFSRRSGRHTSDETVLAALDLGTNNCRLLVARPNKRGFSVIDAFSRIVRLGEGLGRSGHLSEPAMDRTIEALKVCADKMHRRRVTRSRVVATEACRQAENCDEFLLRVRDRTGLVIEIISNQEEAELALNGCVPLLDPAIPDAIVFDIGGGSTEIAWAKRDAAGIRQELAVMSIPIGVVTLAERFGGDSYEPEDYRAMIRELADPIRCFDEEHGIAKIFSDGRAQMVGTSGTVTTLAGVHLKLPRYVRDRVDGVYLKYEQVRRVADDLATMNFAGRAAQPCIGTERADLVVAGCAILEAILDRWPAPRIRVGDRGVREGILFGLMEDQP